MNLSKIVIAALSLSAMTAFAESPNAGQFTTAAPAQASRAQVQAELQQYRAARVNPWSTSFNPLKGFQSQRSRAEVTAEYIRSRDSVNALTREDSGSAYLAARRGNAAEAAVGAD